MRGLLELGLRNSELPCEGDIHSLVERLKKEGKTKTEKDGKICLDEDLSAYTFAPPPDSLLLYDTTNHPDGNGLKMGNKVNTWDEDSPVVTEALIDRYKAATKEQKDKYGCGGWYDYNCKYLGTKWNFALQLGDFTEAGKYVLDIQCETAWSPPDSWLCRIQAKFPGLRIFLCTRDEFINYYYYGEVLAGDFVTKRDVTDDIASRSRDDDFDILDEIDAVEEEFFDYTLRRIRE